MSEKLDRYKIMEQIGQGGFAIVYRGHDTELDRPVALKELRSVLLTDTDWVRRFRREARAIARLDHPRIVTIHDVNQAEKRQFIIMRLVNGPGLDELLATGGRMPWPEAIELITAVAEGLDYAHSQGILHRDLKPANILMDPERGPLLSDFGFAKLAGEHSMSMSGDVVGTPHYIAPEVWEGQKATSQADIYALGCILYEVLTSEKVFPGETPPAVMLAHFKPLELPKTWPQGTPPGVANVLTTALAKNPADRYTTAGEMVKALVALTMAEPVEPDRLPKSVVAPGMADQDIAPAQPEIMAPEIEAQQPDQKEAAELAQPDLALQAHSEQVARWRQKAEQALAEGNVEDAEQALKEMAEIALEHWLAGGNLEAAEQAARHWQALTPDAPDLIAFRQKLQEQARPLEKTPEPGTPPPSPLATPPPASQPHAPSQAAVSSTPQPFTPPTEVISTKHKRKGMCLWLSVAILMSLALLIFGLGMFCSAAGGTVGTTFEMIVSKVFPDIEIGTTDIEKIHVPLPEISDTISLELNTDVGELILAPGATEALLEGTASYNVASLKPKVISEGNDFSLQHESGIGPVLGLFRGDIKNVWTLKLASVPMELTINAGAAESNIELGGLSLLDLTINQHTANLELSFSEANQVEMGTLKFKSFIINAALIGLANAKARNIILEGGGGTYSLDFSGQLQNDVDVSLPSNFGGSVTIIVPEHMAAQVSVDDEATAVNAKGEWQKSGDKYILPGASGADHQITIEVPMDTASLKLRHP